MKRNQPFLLLVIVAILVIAFSSFNKDDKKRFEGYTPIENGSYFLLIKKGAGITTVDTGGAAFVKIKFKTEQDSVFMDINQEARTESYPLRIDKADFKGDFLDIIMRLHVGDSASFFVKLDSLKKYYPEEFNFHDAQFDTMQYLGFSIKVDSIYDRKKLQEIRAEAEAEQKKQQEMMLVTKAEEPAAIKKYIADNKIKVKPTPGGLYYIQTKKGKGPTIKDGQTVKVIYTGKFLNGEVFDSNQKPGGEPFEFIMGTKQVIPGFEEGIRMMKKGGKATLIIPSELAYGDGGGRMKPYATLVFDIELIEITNAPK